MTSSSRYGRRSEARIRPKFSSAEPYGRAVVVGQVDVRDAEVERPAQDRALRVERRGVPEVVPEAERERGQVQAAAAGPAVGHGVVAGGVGVERHESNAIRRIGPCCTSRSSSPASPATPATPSGWPPGTGATLHLVEPLGFDLSEAKLRRAGLDYHDLAHVVVHPVARRPAGRAARPGARVHHAGDAAPHGRRLGRRATSCCSAPSPRACPTRCSPTRASPTGVRIPMLPGRRSMNLSNAAAVGTYEAWRQLGFAGGV